MKIRVILEKDEAGYYVAEVPAMPGRVSHGRNRRKIIANIRGAIAGWLEVMASGGYSSLSLGMGAAGLRTRRASAFSAVAPALGGPA